jgi:ubiquitin-conjugating enzyme E2 Q
VWTVALEPRLLRQHGLGGTLVVDLARWARMVKKPEALVLEVRFPSSYPRDPPFVRVVRPRFAAYTGHVTAGGSICTELLTSSGWRCDMTVSSMLRTVCEGFRDGDGRIQFEGSLYGNDYELVEAEVAFDRALLTHGWRAPRRGL